MGSDEEIETDAPIVRSPNYRQVVADHIWASFGPDGLLRLAIAADSLAGTHDDLDVEHQLEMELVIPSDSVEMLESILAHREEHLASLEEEQDD